MSEIKGSEPESTVIKQKIKAPNERWEFILTIILLGLIVCLVFADSLFFKKAYYWGDIGLFFLPLSHFLQQNLAKGQIPLWNPYLFCGAPYVGNPQVSVLYPTNLFLFVAPAISAIMYSEAVQIFLGGLFFWIFARFGSLRLAYLPSVFAATMYMLSGYFVAKSQFPNMLASLSYVPLVLYSAELLVKKPHLRSGVFYGVALGLQLLAAHTQIAVFTLYLTVAYGLWIFIDSSKPELFLKTLAYAIIGGVAAAGISCCYWLPTAQLIQSSARQMLSLHASNRFYLPYNELGNFVFAHLYGAPIRGDWSAHGNYWETDNYIGIVPFALAVYGIVTALRKENKAAKDRNQLLFWLCTFLISIWLSLGMSGGLYDVAFCVLPALRLFHDPARLTLGATVAVSLFGGLGLQRLLKELTLKHAQLVGVALLLISAADMGRHCRSIYPLKPVSIIEGMSDADVPQLLRSNLSAPGAGRIMMPDSQRAWQSFTTYRAYEQNDPKFMTEWPDTLSPCLGMTDGIKEVGGYDPEVRRDSSKLYLTAQNLLVAPVGSPVQALPPPPPSFAEYLGDLGVQYLVAYRVGSVDASGLTPIDQPAWQRHHRKVTVYQNLYYQGRARLYDRWTNVANQDTAYNDLDRELVSGITPNSIGGPYVENAPFGGVDENGSSAPVKFLKDTPDLVEIQTDPISKPSLLILDDSLHPGWTVTVDSTPSKLYRANVDQRAVLLPSSAVATVHDVRFVYRPIDFLVGVYLSLLSLCSVLAVFVAARFAGHSLSGATRT